MEIKVKKAVSLALLFICGMFFAGNMAVAEAEAKKPVVKVQAKKVKRGEISYEVKDNVLYIKQKLKNTSSFKIKKIEAAYSLKWSLSLQEPVSGPAVTDDNLEQNMMTVEEVYADIGKIEPNKAEILTLTVPAPEGYEIQNVAEVKLKQLKIYSGTGAVVYDVEKDSSQVVWGSKDKTAPVISGIVGAKAYNKHYKDVCRTVYKGEEKWLLKYVSAEDDRDGKVKVTVDTSAINWDKKGIYTVIYKATDKAGNVARVKTKVQVRRKNDDLDRYAYQILKKITKEGDSDVKKAKAIYKYVRAHMGYVDSNEHASWEKSALPALRYGSGNCFRYYSLSRLLLTRCGIVNQTVTRYKGYGHHWWNYVYVNGGWYHFDTTPRRMKGNFCLKTSAQMTAYSKKSGNSHIWNTKWIPKGATKKIN